MPDYSCLVVDDSPVMRQLIVFAVGRIKNVTVTEADDGVVGLRKLAGQRFDLIITDLNMPIMNGLKLIRHVRMDEKHKTVPILVITTEGGDEDRERAMALGATAYITKPIQAPVVVAKVKELLAIE
jgi:two-component system chemotaxis response regulator CheY